MEGYQDALRFLKLSGLIRCTDCKTVMTSSRVDCPGCLEVEEQAEKSELPMGLRQVFEEARVVEAAADGIFSWLMRPIEIEDPFMCLLT